MVYVIVCSRLFAAEGELIGPILAPHADEYLPKYRDQEFASRTDAIKWI